MRRTHDRALRLGWAAVILMAACPVWAGAAGPVRITVRFALPSGELQPLPGATVTLQPEAREQPLQSFTGDDGRVEFADVAAGAYVVQAAMDGFVTTRRKVTVLREQALDVELTLPLAQLAASVDVVAESEQEQVRQPT
ncbi:MAG TPA: carboxypeptidase-like regulatory domain-containing protein, partial [Acidobacteriota bacterium]|nr:carboxypeptidase-like regulatory domain-containing protein [Acidobacteriota bacterium]